MLKNLQSAAVVIGALMVNYIFIVNLINCLQGYGTNFYTDDEYYEGEWYADKRSGWGRMYYKDGTIYEGEWYDDKRNGQGMLRLSKNNIRAYPDSEFVVANTLVKWKKIGAKSN